MTVVARQVGQGAGAVPRGARWGRWSACVLAVAALLGCQTEALPVAPPAAAGGPAPSPTANTPAPAAPAPSPSALAVPQPSAVPAPAPVPPPPMPPPVSAPVPSAPTSTGDGPDTFETLYSAVFAPRNCDSYLCHGAGAGGLDFTTVDEAYADMVGAPATGLDCADLGLARVVPGDPEASLLYLKLFDEVPCGEPMPPRAARRLTEPERARVRAWIAAGAPR